jgi:isopentenyldiphosphate isomerase
MKIPIVDEEDNLICYKDANERDPKKEITRTSALWLINELGEVLVAKRSINKRYHPGLWGCSVTGVNEEGETYESNIIKEVQEELGYNLEEIITGYKELISSERSFFVQHFFAKIPQNTKFVLQKIEVEEVRWVKLEDLENWAYKFPAEFNPHFKHSIKAIKKHANKS